MKSISKSSFLAGLKCPKYLWCKFNAPKMIPPPDAATQARFDQGHEIGALARKYFAGGAEGHTIEKTKELMAKKKPIYEAAFAFKEAYCRADVLVAEKADWDIVEVKSTSKVKDDHLYDVAFQRYCLEGAGVHVRKCFLMHINSEYVRKGAIDVQQLFAKDDITDDVNEKLPEIEERLSEMIKIINGPMPKIVLGVDCADPENCPVCCQELEKLPAQNVTELYRLGKKAYELLNDGIILLKDIPKSTELGEKQRIQQQAAVKNKPFIDKKAIKQFIDGLHYPLHMLDFEAVNPAIPLFDGTHPFQNVPFQLSLHIIDKPGAKARHIAFLADSPEDPRKGVVETLKEIGPKGTVLAYYMAFEKGVIENLADAFPKEKWLHALVDRLDDLIVPFRSFQYYDSKQRGSCSIKAVLPALTGKSYEHLEISQGDQAAQTFLVKMYEEGKVDEKLRKALLTYCEQDTQAMIDILKVLEKAVE